MSQSTIRYAILGASFVVGSILLTVSVCVTSLSLAMFAPGTTLAVTSLLYTAGLFLGADSTPLGLWLPGYYRGLIAIGLLASAVTGVMWAADSTSAAGWLGVAVAVICLSALGFMTWRVLKDS